MLKLLVVVVGFLVTLVSAGVSHAEQSVGFAAGPTKGLGPTYRYLSDDGPWGWQVTGLPVVMPDGGFADAGASVLYVLHRGKYGSAHLSLGAAAGVSWNICEEGQPEFECSEDIDWLAAFGPGVGFDLHLVDNFAWSVEASLPLFFSNGDFEGMYPIPNSSLLYYW